MTLEEYIPLALRTESTRKDPPERRVLHAAVGLTTEAVELLFATDDVNRFEELGDLMWYWAVMKDAIGYAPVELSELGEVPADALRENILLSAGVILDLVKKNQFYGKPFDSLMNGARINHWSIVQDVSNHAGMLGYDLSEVLEANIRKLRVRYPEKFSLENAEVRDLNAERKVFEGENQTL